MTNTPNDYLTVRAFREAEGMQAWPVLSTGATAFFPTDSFATSARLVQAIAGLEGIAQHAQVDIRADGVTVRLVTLADDWYGMSQRDLALARGITQAAAQLGLTPDTAKVQAVDLIVIGAVDVTRVMPFWQALLDYVPRPDSADEDLVDPRGLGPGIWFEQLARAGAERNRMHIAVWLPYEHAEARIAAAVAAGGTVIYDERAPAWWTLADPEGNEADISTSMSRDG